MSQPVTVHHGDALDVLAGMDADSVDAVCTDPPYGLEFMGVAWDTMRDDGKPRARNEWGDPSEVQRIHRKKGLAFYEFSLAWAVECLRVLKPGGHMLAFGGSRTFHRLACAIEDAGFEIRDTISWLYGSGFPKSHNLNGDRSGWGTALKPAWEPIIVARKPLAGTVAGNVQAFGTGALNVDGCRVAHRDEADRHESETKNRHAAFGTEPGRNQVYGDYSTTPVKDYNGAAGRWPTNVVLDETAAAELDQQSGVIVDRNGGRGGWRDGYVSGTAEADTDTPTYRGEGGASRFFPTFRYEAKAGTDQRPRVNGTAHPTVKPLDLIRWLVRLVTPPGGTVLDPFAGSGTTGEAAAIEGFQAVLIEREADYLPLIEARLSKPLQSVLPLEVTS